MITGVLHKHLRAPSEELIECCLWSETIYIPDVSHLFPFRSQLKAWHSSNKDPQASPLRRWHYIAKYEPDQCWYQTHELLINRWLPAQPWLTIAAFQQETGKIKEKGNSHYSDKIFNVPKTPSFCSHLSKAISVLWALGWDNCTAEAFLAGVQRVLLKLRFHQWNLFEPHLASQPEFTGLAGTSVSVLEAFARRVLSVRNRTSSHPKSPEPERIS